MRILILEDENIIAESLFELLLMLDHEPLQPTVNPDDAIRRLEEESPDLILLELTLGNGRSGLDLLQYMQRHKINIPFIVLTSQSDAVSIASVKKYKPGAYLIKPFQRESLFAAIELLTPEPAEQETPAEHEIFLKTGSRFEKLDLHNLVYLKASGKYTELHFTFGKRLVRMPLYAFLEENSNVRLLRVHKTYAVNPEFISSITSDELLVDKNRIPIGRYFMPYVSHFLNRRSFSRKNG